MKCKEKREWKSINITRKNLFLADSVAIYLIHTNQTKHTMHKIMTIVFGRHMHNAHIDHFARQIEANRTHKKKKKCVCVCSKVRLLAVCHCRHPNRFIFRGLILPNGVVRWCCAFILYQKRQSHPLATTSLSSSANNDRICCNGNSQRTYAAEGISDDWI